VSFLSKLVKKVKKPLLGAARAALSISTGGLSEKAIGLANTAKKALAVGKVNKKLSAMPRLQIADVKYSVPAPSEGVGVKATTMPGGAKLRAPARKKRAPAKAKKATKKAPAKKTGAKRAPPSGGLNLKALSASWKAAGKPGKWIDWVKANSR